MAAKTATLGRHSLLPQAFHSQVGLNLLTTAAPAAFCLRAICGLPLCLCLLLFLCYLQPVWMVINLEGKIKGSYTADKMVEFTRRCVCVCAGPKCVVA